VKYEAMGASIKMFKASTATTEIKQ